jgi:ribosomal-protein-serine acetyltransferase
MSARNVVAMSEIVLRVPEPMDAPAIFEAVRESVAQVSPWMDWCNPDYSLEDAAEWVSSSAASRHRGEAFEFIICAGGGRLLGCCGLNQIDRHNRSANLGYWVRTSATGNGVATAAVRSLAEWGFQNTDLERLEIMPDVENLRSQRVAIAAGARREGLLVSRLFVRGTFRDAVMHSIVRSRWLAE